MSYPWWLVARNLQGISEMKGALANPAILEMFRLSGHGSVRNDETAWCAAFVGACLALSGHASTRSLMARSYDDWGEKLDAPRLGCIVVLTRGDPKGPQGHVGFYAGAEGDSLLLLGGNQSDGVNVASYEKSRLLGFRWPVERAPVATSPLLPNIIQLGGASEPPEEEEFDERGLRDDAEGDRAPDFLPLRPGANPGLRGKIAEIQDRLIQQGYPVGARDSVYGLRTATAVFSFQQANGITPTGIVDAETWFSLQKGEPMPLWPERRNETARSLRQDGSTTINLTDRGRLLALAATGLGALGFTDAQTGLLAKTGRALSAGTAGAPAPGAGVAETPASVTGWAPPADVTADGGATLESILPVLFGAQGGVWVALIGAAVLLWRNAQATAAQRVDEHRTGSNLRF